MSEGQGLVVDGSIQSWLTSRNAPSDQETVTISANEGLRSIGFADLTIGKYGLEHAEEVVYLPESDLKLAHLLKWSSEFLENLKNNKTTVAFLELIRGQNDFPISVANFYVDEAINVVRSAINLDLGIDLQHPDTKLDNTPSYAVANIMIEDANSVQDVIRQTFACLFSKCLVRLIVKTNHFYSAALTAYLVDLMHESGATTAEVSCLGFVTRESIGNERFGKCSSPVKNCKLSTVSIVFKQTDTFAAAQGIIESYFREQYPNMVILVEELAYERFVKDWQRYYSHAVHIGSRLDIKSTVVDAYNSKVNIDLAAIDMKSSHKMSGHAINVLRFRTPSELMALLNHLRKIPMVTLWNDDTLLCREFCLQINQSSEFWINHVPKSLSGHRFSADVMNTYGQFVAEDMAVIYNSINSQYPDELDQLLKVQKAFMKRDSRLRSTLIIHAYTMLITRCKSLKNGSTIPESVALLRKFQHRLSSRLIQCPESGSLIETNPVPIGMALLMVREESAIKNRSVLVDLIFKNLLIGNAVFLSCPPNTLGAKFALENDHFIPFKMVHDSLPDISRLSLDASIEMGEGCKKQCPRNTYAIEVLPEMTGESCEALTVALGTRAKSVWFSGVAQTNYWSNE